MYDYGLTPDVETQTRLAAQFDGHGRVIPTEGSAILRILVPGCSVLPGTLCHFTKSVSGSWLLTGEEARAFLQYIAPYALKKKLCIETALFEWKKVKAAIREHKRLRRDSKQRVLCNCS